MDLYYETAYIKLPKGPIRITTMIKEVVKHPLKLAKSVMINPGRIPNIIKRLRI